MSKISKSPQRHSFAKLSLQRRLINDPNNSLAAKMLEFYSIFEKEELILEQDTNWQKYNLEYDLRSNDMMCEKVRASKAYAQNLYAALCNVSWQKLEVLLVLKEQQWTCSWRSAGGIIANMRQEGDYVDWYCSGIQNLDYDEKINESWDKRNCVPEGMVTDEIREDLKKIGWVPIEEK